MREPDKTFGEFAVFGRVELYLRDGSWCVVGDDGSVPISETDAFRDDLAAALAWHERRKAAVD